MKVTIDSSACQGHGRCYSLGPEVYTSDDEGYAQVVAGDVGAELRDQAELGAANCPEHAITVEG